MRIIEKLQPGSPARSGSEDLVDFESMIGRPRINTKKVDFSALRARHGSLEGQEEVKLG